MPRARPVPRHPLPVGGFAAHEWRLLVQLPAEVMIATVAARDGSGPPGESGRRTVAEGLAGLDGIAAGRSSDSDLVRAVVAAIFAEPEPEPEPESQSLAQSLAQPQRLAQPEPQRPAAPEPDPGGRDRMLAHCRRVGNLLRAADPADAAAYRHWVQQVAVRVCQAAHSPGVLGLAAAEPGRRSRGPLNPTERAFLADLTAALA